MADKKTTTGRDDSRDLRDSVEHAGQDARRSTPMRWLARVGLIAYGVVHLLIAWVAGQLAFGQSDQEASQHGALQELAKQPLGGTSLWLIAMGLFGLTIWQLVEAVFGYRDLDGATRVFKVLSSLGRAAVYLGLGISANGVATGSSFGGARSEQSLTARLLAASAGRVLVAAVGLAIVAIGVRHLYKAITARFTDDLSENPSEPMILLGRIGYAAKGIALGVVGVLFGWAALSYDPQKGGGLDAALRTIRDGPAGPMLLAVIALGIVCFGVYCFRWAGDARL